MNHQQIPIQQLTSGDYLHINVYTVGNKPGPRVYIQANIHGPEVAGSALMNELIQKLPENEINGTITIVISANPIGLNTKMQGFPVGYINHNGDSTKNWNRNYVELPKKTFNIEEFVKDNKDKSPKEIEIKFEEELLKELETIEKEAVRGLKIEDKLSLILQKLAVTSKYVLDVHSAGINQLHLYTFEESIDAAKFFLIPSILVIKGFTGAFDEANFLPWKTLKDIYYKINSKQLPIEREAYTIELENDNEVTSSKIKRYTDMIFNYLISKEILAGEPIELEKYHLCSADDYVKYNAPIAGLVEPLVKVSQYIKKEEPLVCIHSLLGEKKVIRAHENCIINSFPLSKVVSEGEPLIGVLINTKEI